MKYLISSLIAVMALTGTYAASGKTEMRMDSVGHKWVNGKLYVLHKVEQGQTLFAVARRYGVSADAIREANGGANQFRLNEVIQVPYSRFKKKAQAAPAQRNVPSGGVPSGGVPSNPAAPAGKENTAGTVKTAGQPGTHTVEVGQTLYSIATRYGVSQADIRTWNGMQSDNVMLGQVLIVSEKQFRDARQPPKVAPAAADTTRVVPVAEKVVKPVLTPPAAPKEGTVKSVRQQGLAEKIDAGDGSGAKYLALHRDAPIGTLVQVKNEFNQEVIWAKVIGRIPDTSVNEDIVIKLSGRAFDKISPETRRFRAEVTYSEPVR